MDDVDDDFVDFDGVGDVDDEDVVVDDDEEEACVTRA